jgi:biopolymer transport protein TolR
VKLKPKANLRSEINVTPLVDVVLVLLIIFMVVTPLLEKELAVRVPELETEPTPPQDVPQDTVVVQVMNGRLYVNQQELQREALFDRVKQLNDARKDKVVFFDAEDAALYGDAVWVLDTIKRAGTETIGMMLPEPQPPK